MIVFIFYNMQYIIIHNLIQKPDHYCLLAERDGIISDRAQRILNRLYSEKREVVKTSLLSLVSNTYSLDRYLNELSENGLINIREEKIVRRTFYISLTSKGKLVAEQLKKAEEIVNSSMDEIDVELSNEEAEKAKNLTMLFHINVMDDHITVEEVKPGKPSRIFNIYVKRNGNGEFRLWCEHDDSYDCWHVKAAWTYPHVQKMMMHYKGKVKVCPSCGYEDPEAAKFCMNCAAKLE